MKIIIKLSLLFLFPLKSTTCFELLWTWEISANAGPGTSLYLHRYPEISFPFPSHFTMRLGYCSLSQLSMTNFNHPNFQLPSASLPHWPQRNCPTRFPSFLLSLCLPTQYLIIYVNESISIKIMWGERRRVWLWRMCEELQVNTVFL